MELCKALPLSEKQKIYFNHTNPVINSESDTYKAVIKNEFNIAHITILIKL
jgi:hypothetical protein